MSIDLKKSVSRITPKVIEIRRRLHRRPELSGEEKATAELIANELEKAGIPFRSGVGGYGIAASIETGSEDLVALRADMDALPIQDAKRCAYASEVPGVSHACGHDAHCAMLLGAACVLNTLRSHLKSDVLFLFQPAEETTQGARAMLRDGVFDTRQPSRIHALHVYPYLPTGYVGMRVGAMCAATDMFQIELTGRGGHAARPHECDDVVLVASHIVQGLHHIVSRKINPLHPAVLTIGQIQGGKAPNVIPDRVCLSGTVRCLDPHAHEQIRLRMDQIIRQTAEAWGVEARFTIHNASPVLINDAEATIAARERIARWLPEVSIVDIESPSMGGEDFAEFAARVPASLLRLGSGGTPETRYPLHHPRFDIDESALPIGVAVLASLCLPK